MSNKPLHIVYIMANNSQVPYFKWFAEESKKHTNIKFSFICMFPSEPLMIKEMEGIGCDCFWVKYDAKKRKRQLVKSFFNIYNLLIKIKPDIFHSHLFDDSLPGLLAARLARIKIRIITKQDTFFHWEKSKLLVLFDKFNNLNATHIHAVANRNRKFILNNEKASPKKVFLIRNGFPPESITRVRESSVERIRKEYGLKNKILVGTVARFIEWKGHLEILEAAKFLVKKYPNILFVWAGYGSEEYTSLLKKKIEEYGLENNVLIIGWIKREDMPSFYSLLDIYLHPASNEPFGFAITEAFMNKIAVIASKTGSTDLVSDNSEAIIIRDRNIEDIVSGITSVLNNPELKKSLQINGYNMAMKHLSFSRMWNEFYVFYLKTSNRDNLENTKKHVVHLMANQSSVPYFSWFAKESVRQKNITFTFITMYSEKPKMLKEMEALNINCIWIKYNQRYKKINQITSLIKIYLILKKIKPDAINTHLLEDSVPGLIAAKLAGVEQRIITKGDTAFHWYYAPKWVTLDKLNNKMATDVVAISEESKHFILEKEKADKNKVTMIHHGIPIKEILQSVDERKKIEFQKTYNPENKFLIGVVSRYVEWKGYKYILEAAKIAQNKFPNVHFLFVGMGTEKNSLISELDSKNINNVSICSWVEPQDMPSLFSSFNAFLHAASMEPFGFVIAEAMAHSLPIISTPTGAAKDAIIHLENGYLTQEKDSKSIVEGINYLLNNDLSEMKKNAFETASKLYDFSIMYNNYLKLYSKN